MFWPYSVTNLISSLFLLILPQPCWPPQAFLNLSISFPPKSLLLFLFPIPQIYHHRYYLGSLLTAFRSYSSITSSEESSSTSLFEIEPIAPSVYPLKFSYISSQQWSFSGYFMYMCICIYEGILFINALLDFQNLTPLKARTLLVLFISTHNFKNCA